MTTRPAADETPADGHTFRLTYTSRGSYTIGDDDLYRDSAYFSGVPVTFDVRGWSIRDALRKAADLPARTLLGDAELLGDSAWVQTHSGRAFDPLHPNPDDVHAPDIAHALSLLCRYNGQTDRFYSVAEHCVLVSRALPGDDPLLRLHGLLHDAAEAYIGDMVRPLKRVLPMFSIIEDNLLSAIWHAFGITGPIPDAVHDADARILLDERAALMKTPPKPWGIEHLHPLGAPIAGLGPNAAEGLWLLELDRILSDLADLEGRTR